MDHLTTVPAEAVIGHPGAEAAAPRIDLQQFCGTDECRPYLMKPFSCEGYTWATNGHILVRVTLRPDIPDVEKKFRQAAPLAGLDEATFYRPQVTLPPAPTELGPCVSCAGRGYAHACRDCECVCEDCRGIGAINIEVITSTRIGPKIYSLHYVRQVLSLPNVELAVSPPERIEKPLLFRFDGGVGALMPMSSERERHIEIAASSAPG